MEPAVVLDQRRMRRARQDAHHLLDGVVRQIRIEAMQRGTETASQHDLGRTATFPRVVDLDAALGGSADRTEVDDGDVLLKRLPCSVGEDIVKQHAAFHADLADQQLGQQVVAHLGEFRGFLQRCQQ
jgi:hypothetical protein